VRQEGVVLRRRHRQVVVERDVVHLRAQTRQTTSRSAARWPAQQGEKRQPKWQKGEKRLVPGHPRRSSG
jgi:hypothetical protein